jgi:WD40 repeat protein/uncharacterized caspase-like protein
MNQIRASLLIVALFAFVSPATRAQQPELSIQTGHSEPILSVAFSPDGRLLASGSQDFTIKLWHSATGLELRALRGHSHNVNSIVFSADGRLLASGSADKTVNIWEVATGRLLRSLDDHDKGVAAVVFLPDGRTLISGSSDTTIKFWDTANGQLRRTLTGHEREVYALSLSADGRTLASASYDRTIKLWDVATGQVRRTLAERAGSMALSPDGTTVATGGLAFKLWDVASGAARTLEQQQFSGSSGMPGSTVAFHPDSRMLLAVSSNGDIKRWNVATGIPMGSVRGASGFTNALAYSADGRMLAGGGYDRAVRIWNAVNNTLARTLTKRSDAMHSVAFSPNSRSLVVGQYFISGTNAVSVWDLVSGEPPQAAPGEQSSAYDAIFSANGRQLASGGLDNSIVLRDLAAARVLRVIEAGGPVDHLSASRDGKVLASVGRDQFVSVWDADSGRLARRIDAHPMIVFDAALSPDGRTLASAGRDYMVKLWDVASGSLRRTVEHRTEALAFSPDGRTVALGGMDNSIALLNSATGQVQQLPDGHDKFVTNLAFNADGKTLASASRDWTVKLWDVEGVRLRGTLKGHTNDVQGLAFSPDGRLLATSSWDTTVKLWELPTGKELASLLMLDGQDWLVVTPDGLFDGSPGAWGKILWRFSAQMNDVAPVEIFFNEFFYPGLLTELVAGKRPLAARNIQQIDRRQAQLQLSLPGASANAAISERRVKAAVTIAQAPAGAQDVRLFRNGALVKAWRGDVLKGKGQITLETEVGLVAGANRFSAYAFNRDNVKSADAVLTVTGKATAQQPPTTYILAVGVNEYANPQFNLRYAVADADDFAAELQRQQQRLNPGARIEILPLRDKGATKGQMLKTLADLAARVQPEDTVIVFFAGHGLAHGQRFYLVPHDLGYSGGRQMGDADLPTVLAHSISDRELERAFEGVDASRLLLVIDACNSGQALDAAERRRGPMNSAGLAQLAYEKGMYVLTAAQSYQAALELSELQHGLLTYALIEEGVKRNAADSEPKDGSILLREWVNYAAGRVPRLQLERMRQAGQRGIKLAYVAGDEGIADVEQRNVQRPRVFYRRELESEPFVVARSQAAPR